MFYDSTVGDMHFAEEVRQRLANIENELNTQNKLKIIELSQKYHLSIKEIKKIINEN